MALKYTGTGVFKYGLDIQGLFPLDSREVVQHANDLTEYKTLFVSGGVPTWYVGMIVFAEDTKKTYVLKSESEGFVPIGIDGTIYTYKGSKSTYALLPTTDNKEGDVWNVTSESVVNIVNSNSTVTYPPGTNFAWTGEAWDALGGSVDLSSYVIKPELDSAIINAIDNTTTSSKLVNGLIPIISVKISGGENNLLTTNGTSGLLVDKTVIEDMIESELTSALAWTEVGQQTS